MSDCDLRPIGVPLRWFLVALIVLNAIVLLGQLLPEGAPPFARVVNIIFLIANLVFLAGAARRR